MTIHLIVVEIFLSGPKWWTDRRRPPCGGEVKLNLSRWETLTCSEKHLFVLSAQSQWNQERFLKLAVYWRNTFTQGLTVVHIKLSLRFMFFSTKQRRGARLSAARCTWASANYIIGLAAACDWILLTYFLCSQQAADSTLQTTQTILSFKAESPHRQPRWGLWVIMRR